MSDEATIAASSLLTSLLGTVSTQSLPQGAELGTPLDPTNADNPSAFEQVLASNFDAEVDSTQRSDVIGLAGSGFASQHLGSRLAPQEDALVRSEVSLSTLPALNSNTAPNTETGNTSPSGGEQLPIPEIDALSRELAGQNLSRELDTVDNPANTREEQLSESQHQSDSDQRLLAATIDETTLATPANLTPVPQTAASSVSTAVSSSAPDNGSTKPLSSGIQNTSSAGGDAAFADGNEDANLDFSQNDSADGASELIAPSRTKEPTTAQFAQSSIASEELLNPNQPSARGAGDTLTGLLNSTSSVLSGTASTSSTTLALATDKNLAGAQVAQALTGFIRQGDDNAEINLSPPHLGKISVRIALQNEQVSVVVTSPMAEVRDVIEASLPRLEELLSEAGLSLGDASVFDQSAQEQNNAALSNNLPTDSSLDASDDGQQPEQRFVSSRLIDAYA